MRSQHFKQCACISENSAELFQEKANDILARFTDPEIIMDPSKPFTMYAFYTVSKDMPETVLELLEMLDANGGNATCENCPAFIRSKDRRRKWGSCRRKGIKAKCDARACELYYLQLRREAEQITKEFEQIPYTID